MKSSALSLACLLLITLTACDTSTDNAPETTTREGITDTELTGAALTVRIASAVPDPPIRSDVNTWRFEVIDANGDPLDGCTLVVEPTMPAHGHGTTPAPTVTPVDGVAGTYEARPLNLFMPGEWHIAVRPSCGSTADEVVFVVPIES